MGSCDYDCDFARNRVLVYLLYTKYGICGDE